MQCITFNIAFKKVEYNHEYEGKDSSYLEADF